MGALKRLVKFGMGAVVGAAVGTAGAGLRAPQSGRELHRKVTMRLNEAKLAGVEAEAAKQEELIRRFRGTVNDPMALEEERARARTEVGTTAQALRASSSNNDL